MNSKKVLETERLLLREFSINDAPFILELLNTPKWKQFIGDRNVNSLTDAEQFLENNLIKSYSENGFGLWMVEIVNKRTPIGMCGLVNRDSLDDVDIGFALLPGFEKKGYAYEMAKATLDFGTNELGLKKIVGITDAKNIHSITLLNKLGLHFEKELQLSEYDTVQLYSQLKVIHVLNGDALKDQFPSEIKGEIIVARECMVDGSVKGNTLEEIFASRAEFINKTFDEPKEDYYFKSVSEFEKIKNNANHSEFNLWFEDDLFCQVNFWFVIHFILEHKIEASLYLIRPISKHQYGFGGMNQLELKEAFKNKIRIDDVKELGDFWKLFQNENISEMIRLSEKIQETYPFILPAVIAYKESIENNRPKESIKAIINELNTKEFGPVFRVFSKREAIYGYGDVQVKRLFDEVIKEIEN